MYKTNKGKNTRLFPRRIICISSPHPSVGEGRRACTVLYTVPAKHRVKRLREREVWGAVGLLVGLLADGRGLDAQCTYCRKSTTVSVPSSELGLSQPLSRQQVCPSPKNRGGGHIRLQVRGWGSPNSNDWRKSLALCLLCG
jgi:hypothetical protein